ncbi:MAG: metal ABC transporter ATP-binding protein [Planctomycetota bacterium]|jgi:zinc transport system ATP-binding protein
MGADTTASSNAIRFHNVTATLGGVHILDRVCARIPRESCTAIVGPNGAGKTTLLLALLGQIPYQGEIQQGSETPMRVGYVPQRLSFDRGMPITVLEFMTMGRQRTPLWFGVRPRHRERAMAMLKLVKAEALAGRHIGALSGGELQRILLALALGEEPDLLVLDEPAAGVDFHGEQLFCELLDGLRAERGFTQLMVSHDLATITHHATHVIGLNRRVIAEGAPTEVLTEGNLTALFGLHMGLVNSRALSKGDGSCTAPCCAKEKAGD